RRIAAGIQRVNASVAHIYFGHIGMELLPFIEISPVPVVVSFHGADAMVHMDKPAYRSAMQRMLAKVDLVLARSDSLALRLRELGCDSEKIRIHRTGIPLDQLPFAERDPPRDGAWRLMQACRLIEKKGLHTSIAAF